MPGTQHGHESRADDAPESRPARATAARIPLARVVAGRTVDLLRDAIARIGVAPARSAAEAEGLALAGRSASALVHADGAPGAPPSVRGPWVEHRVTASVPLDAGHAFVLTAGSPQEALDHVTIGRLLAERCRRPVLCVVPPSVAERTAAVIAPAGAIGAAGNGIDGDATPLDVAQRAFVDGSLLLGRVVTPLGRAHGESARIAVTVAGGAATSLDAAVEMLRAAGIAAAALHVSLRRPFPAAWLAAELHEVSDVVVVGENETREAGTLATELSTVESAARVHAVSVTDCDDAVALARAVALTLGLELELEPAGRVAERAAVVAVHPASTAGRDLILRAVAPLAAARALPLAMAGSWPWASGVALGAGPIDAIDVLVVADPRLLVGTRELASIREGGVVLVTDGDAALDEHQTGLTRAHGVHVLTVGADGDGGDAAARLGGAILGALGRADAGMSADPLADVAALTTDDDVAPWRAGAAALVDALERTPPTPSAASDEPRLPAGEPGTAADDAAVRRFHMTGAGLETGRAAAALLPLTPLALGATFLENEDDAPFPLLAFESDGELAAQPAAEWIRTACAGLDLLGRHTARLTGLVERALGPAGARAPFGAILDLAAEAFRRSVDVSTAGAEALDAELLRMRDSVPPGAAIFPAAPCAARALHRELAVRDRQRRSAAARDEARRLARRLDQTLAVDAGHRPADAASLSSSLGGGGDLLDVDALSRTLPAAHGSRDLAPERRRRLEEARATLLRFAEADLAAAIVVATPALPDAPIPAGVRIETHGDPLRAAIGLADGAAAALLPVIRALRVARLEARGDYDPAQHDEILDALDTDGLTDDEIRLAPAIVVEIDGDRVRRPAELGALSELLRSGRPIQVVIEDRVAAALAGDTAAGHRVGHADLGSLAVAHRAAFVARATLARARHAAGAFRRMAESLLPAVAIVAVPEPGSVVPAGVQLASALYGRATPCFVHDPAAGANWAERFSIEGNPSPELAWPELTVAVRSGDAADDSLTERSESFTFAHAAALDTAARRDFRELDLEQFSDAQCEIAEWLGPDPGRRRGRVPFVWTVGADRVVRRAIMTRELAAATADRQQAWHILQELAGTDNEFARRAAELARSRALDEAAAERDALEARWQVRLDDARREGAEEAVDRIVRVLIDPDAAPAAPAAAAPAAVAPAAGSRDPLAMLAPTPSAVPTAEPLESSVDDRVDEGADTTTDEEDDDIALDEAYVDSALCTTCNECTNLNSKLFIYNANRQAEIGDLGAGTYDQLVRAAERCPARCIHPGAPRDSDPTVTEDLIARAARFR